MSEIDPDTQYIIDKALNDLMHYTCSNLADGWSIEICMTGDQDSGEASIELFDPDGEPVSRDWDGERTNVWHMVDYSQNPEA